MQDYVWQIDHTGNFPHNSDDLFHWSVEDITSPTERGSPQQAELRKYGQKMSDTLLRMLRRWSAGPWAQGNKDSSVLFGHWNQCTAGSRTCLCVRAPCHIFLVHGGSFQCRMLGNNTRDFTLELPPATPAIFDSGKDAARLARAEFSSYCMPVASQQAAVDSLCSPVCLFQVLAHHPHEDCMTGACKLNTLLLPVPTAKSCGV